jgi:hypothetical protein
MTKRSLSPLVAVAITLAAAADPAWHLVRPNAHELVTGHARDWSRHFRVVVHGVNGDTTTRSLGEQWVAEHAMEEGGQRTLLLTWQSGATAANVDTIAVRGNGLAPTWEHLHLGKRLIALTYDGARVTRTVTSPDSAARTNDTTFAEPVFGFNQLDFVIRSLPLRDGYSAILPLYSEATGELEMDSVSVERTTPDAKWIVRFADPAIVATYTIDTLARRTDGYEVVSRKRPGVMRREPIP